MRIDNIKVECDSCGGTGVYVGFAEPEGYGVICGSCGGRGYYVPKLKVFEQIKRKHVKFVIIGHALGWATNKQSDRLKSAIPVDEFYKKMESPA